MAYENNRPPWDFLNSVFRYKAREVPGPGSGKYSIQPGFSLPGSSLGGPGVIYGGGSSGLDVLAGPQLYYHQAQVVDGVNGVVFGGINPQGLVDMDKLIKAQAA